MATRARVVRRNSSTKLLSMILVGVGLLIFGVAALFLLPKSQIGTTEARSSSGEGPSAIPIQVNFPAPDLSLTDLNGKAVALSDFRGQIVLVNNWATWCPPCKAEMPTLLAFYEDHRRQNFTILAIEAGDTVGNVAAFAKDYGLTFPVWPDPQQRALRTFRNDALPNSYLIDRSGQVRLTWTGSITRAVLDKYVAPLLEE